MSLGLCFRGTEDCEYDAAFRLNCVRGSDCQSNYFHYNRAKNLAIFSIPLSMTSIEVA